jgi:hypothetical protein
MHARNKLVLLLVRSQLLYQLFIFANAMRRGLWLQFLVQEAR